ncbi:pyrroline-5-carboxylate reductase [Olsenella urininfantis]|uniref:pyrroline-5-carboxylate reductase n=1 Tax=Olsenella urininfantis TaxID=1871033 RepID=UPI0009878925|nr:pyrroline-5-carboxylate reductase [Olsenella urininfantis]
MSLPADTSIAFIGVGAMGSSIASGLLASGALEGSQVLACDHSASKLEPLRRLGARTFPGARELLAQDPSVVVLAVKPQVLPALLEELAGRLEGRLVVSIAAGVSLEALEGLLPKSRVVRAMPNLPVQLRSGATAVCGGTSARAEDVLLVQEAFSAVGVACVMREDQLDAESAVVGCAPAFMALFLDQLVRAGVERGLPAPACRSMLLSTMRGVAEQLMDGGEHPRAYMERVTSPGGTTAAALRAMEPQALGAVFGGVDAALARNAELMGRRERS